MLSWMGEEAFPTVSSPCAGKMEPIYSPTACLLKASSEGVWAAREGAAALMWHPARSACSAMNASLPGSQLRQPDPQDAAAFTPISVVRSVTKKSDALPVISTIVIIFVLLAVFIIIAVHYGPHLRTVQITLYQEPMPQDLDGGVHLMDWKKLGSQKKLPAQPCQREPGGRTRPARSCQCPCKHHLPCGSAEPNVIEVTYL
ncbi:LOW QUALITY PROTEIN: small integral membrane protein 33 [Tyto alba]|uniref:LOW QUALITY PROTEIN: small integral membrane protein 33 n=1 Tax=Tyto alba TaxID=56313 RepID=UPI001C6870EE|nr:LOW QUALITY PROTEIN: small integral membrane protein 33 [Tyto alba]